MQLDRDKIVKEVRWKLGKNIWLIPIRQSRDLTGYFVRVGAPLFLYLTGETVEEVETKLQQPVAQLKRKVPLEDVVERKHYALLAGGK